MAKRKKTNPNIKAGAKWYSARTNMEFARELISMGIIHKIDQEMGIFFRKYGREKYLINPGPPGGQCIVSKQDFERLFRPTLFDNKVKECGAAASAGFEKSFWDRMESLKQNKNDLD